jgi:hypothetical protein
VAELVRLPVPALLERWLALHLRRAKAYSAAEKLETVRSPMESTP